MIKQRISTAALAALAAFCTSATAVQSASSEALEALRENARGELLYKTNPVDSYVLLRSEGRSPLLTDDASAAPGQRAANFLSQFGAAVGIDDPAAQTLVQRISRDRAGNSHVHLSQVHAGLPVFGARLVVHMNDQGITGVSGVAVPDLQALNTAPSQAADKLAATALRSVQKQHPGADLSVESQRLMVYRSGMLDGHAGANYLASEVVVRSQAGDVRERVILDAHQGGVINQINQIHTVLNRQIFTPNQDVPAVIEEGGATAPADQVLTGDAPSDPTSRAPRAPTDNLYIFAGGTYELYRNLFGREGYDDGTTPPEEQVQKSVYLINDACPNAYWNGDSTNYCPGFDADDIVSHEWSHAYTEFTHGLIYQYQSGALNESYSDIFGEMYDLVNGLEGPLGVSLTEGEYYENGGSRWVLGEDLSETAAGILLRDMWDPDNFSPKVPLTGQPIEQTFYPTKSPGSVITSPNYFCGTSDGGGVHTNSGVPNHAFAMLVDGKEFNGVTIPAIGMTRAAHIYFHAMVNYQTPTTNFAQHADALEQSCADLVGVPLTDVLGQDSPDVIGPAECVAVGAAMAAVEMRQNPREKCAYQPLLQPESTTPELCPAGQALAADFSEDWEGGAIPAAWTVSENVTGDTSEGINWLVTDDLPAPHVGQAAFFENSAGGTCAAGGDISGSFRLDTPAVTVTDAASVLSFSHLMQSEFEFDGGNLKVSINGGEFALVPASAYKYNPYNISLETGAATPLPDPVGLTGGGNTNPMAGEDAFSGSDQGESVSHWGTSIVDLAALGVAAGDSVQFRFEFGQDGCNGNQGWFVDEVTLGHCAVSAAASNTEVSAESRAGDSRGGAMNLLILLTLMLLGPRRRRRA